MIRAALARVDRAGTPTAAINVRCFEGVDFAALPVKHFDGAAR